MPGLVVQLVRIPALQAGGREFESHRVHTNIRLSVFEVDRLRCEIFSIRLLRQQYNIDVG